MQSNLRVVSEQEQENFVLLFEESFGYELQPESIEIYKKYAKEHLNDGKSVNYHVEELYLKWNRYRIRDLSSNFFKLDFSFYK